MWYTLLAVMKKEFRQAFRDRRMAAMLLVAPVAQLILLGYAVDLDVDHIPTVVCDQDDSPESRRLVSDFLSTDAFTRVATTWDPNVASRMLEQSQASVAFIIPTGWAGDVESGSQTAIQVLVDGTDPNRAQISANSASAFLLERAMTSTLALVQARLAAQGRVLTPATSQIVPRVLYNPQLKSAVYMVPGVAALLLLVVTTIVTAMGISREREIGTLEQILVTPIRPWVLLLGKCLPFTAVGLFEVTAILTVGSYLFNVPLRGPLVVVAVATLLYLMSTLGTGIFISTISGSQQQALLAGFFFMLPAILLSGFMTPIENMPTWIRPVTLINPVRYFLEILRSCLLKGAGFADVLPQLGALTLFGAAILTLSSLRFQKRLE